ncbi:hypothetical protein [Intestinimonas butyriciproducens]|uniref:phage lytic cycle repressor MrpR family protein n=1 Tax=Intestinimonas butyriciproducens TaxID=1297617 RepID=UPI00189B3000|nr:hypothetical protein [Intestinimonas butyriciproducens]MDB7829199.1 hypothetical protein [Intestinimonas butyriciproducens]
MYNEERKKKFLEDRKKNSAFGRSIFKATEQVEEQYGMDLALLPSEALQSVVNERLGIRTRSVGTAITFIKSYYTWCKENGFDVGNGIDGLSIQNEEKIRNTMVSSPKHLDILLNSVFDPVQEETMDCIYRCFLWMAFSGMEDADAMEVKVDEIDFDDMLIRHNNGEYELYKESIAAFRKACSLTEFVYVNPKYSKKVTRNRFPGEYLMRGIRSEKISLMTMRGIIGTHFRNNGLKISYNRIYLSGVFYRAYEMERAGFTPDFSVLAAERVERIDRNYSENYSKKKVTTAIEQDFIDDYSSWKQAFA